MKKHFKVATIVLISTLLGSCDTGGTPSSIAPSSSGDSSTPASTSSSAPSAYELWLDSDDALDYNGDRKINKDDYTIYLAYTEWKKSEDAIDLNDDSVINYADYEAYQDYLTWTESATRKKDWDGDGKVTINDYLLYLANGEFVGSYNITNYVYVGAGFTIFDSDVLVSDLSKYLYPLTISIDNTGKFSVENVTTAAYSDFGESVKYVLELVNNATIKRLSKTSVVVDSSTKYNSTTLNFTIYLVPNSTGFSTSYTIKEDDYKGVFTCDIVKINE